MEHSDSQYIGSAPKNLPASEGDLGPISGFGRSPGEWQPTQKFLIENSMDRGA